MIPKPFVEDLPSLAHDDCYVTAHAALHHTQVMALLGAFQPTLVSTIWVNLHINTSDVDILCCYSTAESFVDCCDASLGMFDRYCLQKKQGYVLVSFYVGAVEFEIYATTTPIQQQLGYRHFMIMRKLVNIGGLALCKKVKSLKQQGNKTEPALCKILNIIGDPYREILQVEHWSDGEIQQRLQQSLGLR